MYVCVNVTLLNLHPSITAAVFVRTARFFPPPRAPPQPVSPTVHRRGDNYYSNCTQRALNNAPFFPPPPPPFLPRVGGPMANAAAFILLHLIVCRLLPPPLPECVCINNSRTQRQCREGERRERERAPTHGRTDGIEIVLDLLPPLASIETAYTSTAKNGACFCCCVVCVCALCGNGKVGVRRPTEEKKGEERKKRRGGGSQFRETARQLAAAAISSSYFF